MKKLISILLSICIIFSLCTISVIGSNAEVTTEYKDEFAKFALGDKYEELKDEVVYEEYYRYFSEDNNTDTPDWILGRGYYNTYNVPLKYKTCIGYYVIDSGEYLKPFFCTYFVYFPAENKFRSLESAWYSELENLDIAIEECINNGAPGIYRLTDMKNIKYYDKFYDSYFSSGYHEHSYIMTMYDEIYYHYSDESDTEPDWTLIYAPIHPAPVEFAYGNLVGNRVLSVVGGGCEAFSEGYGVYVTETDSFINLRDLNKVVELCPGFVEAIEENEIGQAFGDVDNNGKINVMDATHIQRHIAEMHNDYRIERYFQIHINGGEYYLSMGDYDRDGYTTVMDATAIQRHIAELE